MRKYSLLSRLLQYSVAPAILAASVCAHALTPDWQAQMAPSAEGTSFPAQGPFVVDLPADIDSETLQWLALEIDNIDVTQIVSLEGMSAVIRPPQLLTPGRHTLRLVQYTPEGRIIERGSWNFEVGTGVAFQVQSDLTFNGSSRITDHDIPQESFPEHRTVGDGSWRLEGKVSGGSWEAGGYGELLYNSEPSGGFHELEGGDFLLNASKGPLSLEVGHHAVDVETLIIDNFSRRGASLNFLGVRERLRAAGFAMRAEPIVGFRNGFGVSDEDNRVAGGLFSVKPIPKAADLLSLTGVYLYGTQQDDPGVAVIDDITESSGHAWSVVAESLIGGRALRLRAEYAETMYDADGSAPEGGTERDEGVHFLAVWEPLQGDGEGWRSLAWEFGGEYEKIGTAFQSLGNPGLPSDLEMKRLYTRLGRGGIDLEASVGREMDNVGDSPLIPTARTDIVSLGLNFSPSISTEGKGGFFRRILGQPSLGISAQQAWDQTDSVPADYTGQETDFRSQDLQVTAGSSYSIWDWYFGYSQGLQDDFTDEISDTRSDSYDLTLSLQPGSRVQLGANGQYSRIKELETGLDLESSIWGVDASVVIWPERLTARTAFQVDRQWASDGSEDILTSTTDFDVDLTVVKARSNRPGLSVWVRGQYQDVNDRVFQENDGFPYQVFGGFTLAWSLSYPALY